MSQKYDMTKHILFCFIFLSFGTIAQEKFTISGTISDSFTKPYSDDTARIIDEEVSKLVEFQYQRALTILSENEDKLKLLAEMVPMSQPLLVNVFLMQQLDSGMQILVMVARNLRALLTTK